MASIFAQLIGMASNCAEFVVFLWFQQFQITLIGTECDMLQYIQHLLHSPSRNWWIKCNRFSTFLTDNAQVHVLPVFQNSLGSLNNQALPTAVGILLCSTCRTQMVIRIQRVASPSSATVEVSVLWRTLTDGESTKIPINLVTKKCICL